MTITSAPTTTDWNTVTFAAIAARPYPSLDRPTYNPTGHATAACPAVQGKVVATEASLADYLAENEWFDGEVAYLDVWPCGTCVGVKGTPTTIGYTAPAPTFSTGTGAPRPAVVTEEDPREAEARAYAAAYTGTFGFMVDMKAKAQRPAARLTPKMVDAILRCKAADVARASLPATPAAAAPSATSAPQSDEDARRATLRPNAYAGTCRSCKAEVAANAGRREKVDGRWTVLHSTTTECGQATPQAPAVPLPQVPDGKYAVTADAGHSSFYQVRTPVEGKWAGYVFVDLLIGSPGDWRHQAVRGAQKATILAKIAVDPQEALARYGREFKQCGACDAPLSHDRSKKAGYGQTCAEKRGYAW